MYNVRMYMYMYIETEMHIVSYFCSFIMDSSPSHRTQQVMMCSWLEMPLLLVMPLRTSHVMNSLEREGETGGKVSGYGERGRYRVRGEGERGEG